MDGYLAGKGGPGGGDGRQVGTAAGEDADREAGRLAWQRGFSEQEKGRKDSQRNSGKKGEAGRQTDTCVSVPARTLLLGCRHFGPAPLLLRSAADCGPSAVDGLKDAA